MLQLSSRRFTSLAGLVGVTMILIAMLITAAVYVGPAGDRYSPFNHVISELGHTTDSRLAPLFNLALFLGGLCFLFFLLGVARYFTGWLHPPLIISAVVSGICGAAIGVFPMNASPAHLPLAVGFFGFAFFYVVIFSLRVRHIDTFPRSLAYAGIPMLVSSLVLFLTGLIDTASGQDDFVPAAALRPSVLIFPTAEWLALLTLIGWVILVSMSLRKT